jgi:chain length determinant protein EpsF
MSFLQIIQILRAHWRVALLTPVLVFLLALGFTLQLPKQYTASTSLVIDVKTDPIAGALMPNVGSPAYMTTQTGIIQSDRVAGRVVSLLRLDRNPIAVERWQEETAGKVPIESYWGSLLRKGLVVEPTRGSNIISLTYTGQDPKFAAAVANAYAQSYIGVTIDLRVEPARQYAAWFDERLKELRGNLEAAQTRLSAYQQEKGIVVADERLDQENARLNTLMGELAAAQAATAASVSRFKSSKDAMSPEVQQDPVVQSIKNELARAETRLAEISLNVGENHPQRVQIATQIAGLKQQLDEETRRVTGVSAASTRVSAQREAELRTLIEAQKQRVLSLREERDRLAFYVRDVESAQRAFDVVTQRMSQTSLESQFDQTNVRVLSPAVEPIEPSGPKLARNAAAALLVGILLGAGLAVGLEFLDRRVRTPEDLAVAENVPLLGMLAAKPEQIGLKERLDGLGVLLRNRLRRQPTGAA